MRTAPGYDWASGARPIPRLARAAAGQPAPRQCRRRARVRRVQPDEGAAAAGGPGLAGRAGRPPVAGDDACQPASRRWRPARAAAFDRPGAGTGLVVTDEQGLRSKRERDRWQAWLLTRVDIAALAAGLRLPLAPRVLRLDPALPLGYARDLDVLPNTLPPERHRGYAAAVVRPGAGHACHHPLTSAFRRPRP